MHYNYISVKCPPFYYENQNYYVVGDVHIATVHSVSYVVRSVCRKRTGYIDQSRPKPKNHNSMISICPKTTRYLFPTPKMPVKTILYFSADGQTHDIISNPDRVSCVMVLGCATLFRTSQQRGAHVCFRKMQTVIPLKK